MSTRPDDTDFKQQRLKAWQPVLTPHLVIGVFLIVGLLFPTIGGILLGASSGVVEVSQRYDDQCTIGDTCTITLIVPSDMDAPVYFYYELTNYYQNHRRYVPSRSDAQLQGTVLGESSLSDCDPEITRNSKVLYPCGLVAGSFFTDSFTATILGTPIDWTSRGIAWDTDVDHLFKARAIRSDETNVVDQDGTDVTLPTVEDEEFIVWMRTAGFPTFKKLYRIIRDQDLKSGQVITVSIDNNYDTGAFDGEKRIVLSTTSWFGGKNLFLGWAYISVGICSLLVAGAFTYKHLTSPRKLGDLDFLIQADQVSQ